MSKKGKIQKLLERMSESDEKALAEFINLYFSDLMYFSLKFIPDHTIAEELVQDTFLKVWNKRDKLAEIKSPEIYLFTIAKNLCLDYLKKVNKDRALKKALVQEKENSYNPLNDLSTIHHYEKILQDILDQLPPRQREAFEMSRNQGKSHKQIAENLGISVKTVEVHLNRALHTIRAHLFKSKILIKILTYIFLNNIS